jgi:hypothetical protein
MFYIKVSAVTDELFDSFGMGKVKTGWIPDEQEFINKVKQAYKVQHNLDSWSPTQFVQDVKSLFEDLRRRVMEDKGPAEGKLSGQMEALKRRIAVMEAYVGENKRMMGLLQTNPKAVADVLKKEKGKNKVVTKFYDDKQTVHIDKLKGLDSFIAVLEDGRPAGGGEAEAEYNKAVNFAHRVMQDNIRGGQEQINKYKETLSKLENRMKSMGKPVQVKEIQVKPIVPHPFLELDGLDGFGNKVKNMYPEEPVSLSVESPHPYKWLMKPKEMDAVLNQMMKAPETDDEKGPLRYKSDILEVRQEIHTFIGKLWMLNSRMLKEVPELEKMMKEELHILASLDKQEFDWYKGILKEFKAAHGPQTFADIVKWSEKSGDFEKADQDLPAEVLKDRNTVRDFIGVIKDIRLKNGQLQKNWDPIKAHMNKLKEELSKVREMYNKISKEDYFRQYLRGDIPVEMKAASYEVVAARSLIDPMDEYAKIREEILGFSKFLEAHKMYETAYKNDVVNEKSVKLTVPESAGKQGVKELLQAKQVG